MKKVIPIIVLPLLLTGCAFSFEEVKISSIELTRNDVLIGINQSLEVEAVGYLDSTHKSEYQTFTWSITDSTVASYEVVDSLTVKVTGLTEGETKLVCTSTVDTNVKAECKIKVTTDYVPQTEKMKDSYDDYCRNNYYSPMSNAPLSGELSMLVIPVWFTDSKTYIKNDTYKAQVRDDIEKAYFGTETEVGWQSVKTYYESESRGKLTIDGIVSNWYEPGQSVAYYGNENREYTKTSSLVESAYTWYITNNPSISKDRFDKDGDGYVDAIMLIYAYPNSATLNNSYDNLWAYCYWTGIDANKANPTPNVFFWASYDFMYDSSTASRRAGSSYGYGNCSYQTIDTHTFIHEMGHVFGAEDYYDYSNQYKPAAGFSMQDQNVGAHDPYTRMAYGWDSPIVPTDSCTITINTYENSGDLILLSKDPENFSKSVFDEYLLIELYSPKDLNAFDVTYKYDTDPKGPNQTGIRLWHVDARLLDLTGLDIEKDTVSASKITIGMTEGHQYYHAMSNTYYKRNADSNDYVSYLGQNYADYNILQLIADSLTTTYKPTDFLSSSMLFKNGSTFKMETYKKQFKNSGLLNDGSELGWQFTVDNMTNDSATITLTRV